MSSKKSLLQSHRDIRINVKLSDDESIKALNKKYLSRDFTTDVLSFELKEKDVDGSYYLGDVIVNIDQAKRQAGEYGNTIEQEVAELVEHGVLHLLGVHHEDDDELSVHGKKIQ